MAPRVSWAEGAGIQRDGCEPAYLDQAIMRALEPTAADALDPLRTGGNRVIPEAIALIGFAVAFIYLLLSDNPLER